MKKNLRFLLVITTVVLLVALGITALADSEKSILTRAGEAYADWLDNTGTNNVQSYGNADSNNIVAVYGNNEITRARLDYEMAIADLYDEEGRTIRQDEEKAVMAIITNIIITEEAESLGLGATEEEIEDMVEMTKDAYEMPNGKVMMDEYFTAMGITADEYFELVREQAPGLIARQKLKDSVARAYCEENGLEFTKVNQPEAVQQAVQDYIDELVAEHESEILILND